MRYRDRLFEELQRYKTIKKSLSAITTILLVSSVSSSASAISNGRTVVSIPTAQAFLSTGSGLDRGNIPEGATRLGYFIIPDGGTRNLNLIDDLTPVTFQNNDGAIVAYLNGLPLKGVGLNDKIYNIAYYSDPSLNIDNFNHVKISNNVMSWEDLYNGGDKTFNDVLIAYNAQLLNNNEIPLGSSGYHIVDETKPFNLSVKINNNNRNTTFGSSAGHVFLDKNNNPISGVVDFINVKNNYNDSATIIRYKGITAFSSNDTLQYTQGTTVNSDINNVNIAAIDISTLDVSSTPKLHFSQSASLGSVKNSFVKNSNLLNITIEPNAIINLTGTGGGFADSSYARMNDYSGLGSIDGASIGNGSLLINNQTTSVSLTKKIGGTAPINSLSVMAGSLTTAEDINMTGDLILNDQNDNTSVGTLKLVGTKNTMNINANNIYFIGASNQLGAIMTLASDEGTQNFNINANQFVAGTTFQGILNLNANNNLLILNSTTDIGNSGSGALHAVNTNANNQIITVNPNIYARGVYSNGTGTNIFNGTVNLQNNPPAASGSFNVNGTGTNLLNQGLSGVAGINGNLIYNADGEVQIAADKDLNANVYAIGGTSIGKVTFMGGNSKWNGSAFGPVGTSPIKRLNAGAGSLTLAGGTYNIAETQGTGTDTIILLDGTIINGNVNFSGGQEVNFDARGIVVLNGTTGSHLYPIGNIELTAANTNITLQNHVFANQLEFQAVGGIANLSGVLESNVLFTSGGTLNINSSNAGVNGNIDGAGDILITSNSSNVSFNGNLGSSVPITSINLGAEATANINGDVTFNNPNQAAITLGQNTTLNFIGNRKIYGTNGEYIKGVTDDNGNIIFKGGNSNVTGLSMGVAGGRLDSIIALNNSVVTTDNNIFVQKLIIGDQLKPATLIMQPSKTVAQVVDLLTLANTNSTYQIDSTNATGTLDFYQNTNVHQNTNSGEVFDKVGVIIINANNHPINIHGTGAFGDSDTQRIQSLILMGNAPININIDTHAVEIIDATGGNVTFNKDHTSSTNPPALKLVDAGGETDINADSIYSLIDFRGRDDAKIVVADGVTLTAPLVDSTNQNSGTVEYIGDGNLIGNNFAIPSGIGVLKAGAAGKNVTISGHQTIKDVQGTSDTGSITFAQEAILGGSINLASGAATTLNFNGGGLIDSIGAGAPVGDINLNGPGTMNFLSTVRGRSLNVKDGGTIAKIYDELQTPVNFLSPGILEIANSNVNIAQTIDGTGSVVVDPNLTNITFANDIGSTNPVNSLQIGDGSTVSIKGNVTTNGAATVIGDGARVTIDNNNLTLNTIFNAKNAGNGRISVNSNLAGIVFKKPIGLDAAIDILTIGNDSQVTTNGSIVANDILLANNATLTFNQRGVLIDSLINGYGNIKINDDIENVYFKRAIGNNIGIKQFTMGDRSSVILRDNLLISTASDSGITLGDRSILYINGNNFIDGRIDGPGQIIIGSAPIEADFADRSNVVFNQEVGKTTIPVSLTISDNSSVRFDKIANFTDNITLGSNTLAQFTDDVNTNIINGTNGSSTIEFINPKPIQVKAIVGIEENYLGNIIVSNNDVTISDAQTLTNAITFSNSKMPAILNFVESATTILNGGGITTAGDLIHTIGVRNNFVTSTGAIGGPNNRLKTIELLTNNLPRVHSNIVVNSKDFYSSITTEDPDHGTAFFSAAEGIVFDIGEPRAKLFGVYVNEDITAKGNVYSNDLRIRGKTVSFTGDSAVINSDKIQLNTNSQMLIKGNNTSITGQINSHTIDGNINTIVTVDAHNVSFNSSIGESLAITSLIMNAGSSATLNENISLDSGGVKLNQDSILTLAKDGNIITSNGANIDFISGNGTLNITKTTSTNVSAPIKVDNSGYITANNLTAGSSLIITGPIGSLVDNKYLSSIQATNGGTILLTGGDAFVNNINVGFSDGSLALAQANGNYKFNFSHQASKGNLIIDNNLTLKNGTNVSSSSNPLNTVNFTGDNKLIVEGVDIYTANGINTINPGQGMIEFNGSSTVGAVVGKNNNLNNMLISGTGNVVTFLDKINLTNNLTINPGNIARIKADTFASNIESITPNQGKVEFINNASITVAGNLGSNNKLDKVIMTNHSVTISKDFAANSVDFIKPNQVSALKILGNSNLANMNVTTNSTSRNHDIHVSTDQHITGNWGSANNLMGGIHLRGDNYLKIDTTGFYAGVNISTNNTGTVEFIKKDSFAYALGRFNGNSLKKVLFSEDATSYGVIRSQTIDVADGKTATFDSGFKIEDEDNNPDIIRPHLMSENGMRLGSGSIANFKNNALLDGTIMPKNPGLGVVNFNGRSEIRELMGNAQAKLAEVNFRGINNKDPVRLVKDISANRINFDNVATQVAYTIKLDGPVNARNTDFDLNSKILTLPTGTSIFSGNVNIATSFDGTQGGHIAVTGAGSSLDFSNVDLMNITVTANTNDLVGNQQKGYTLFLEAQNGNVIQNNNINVISNDTNRFVSWIYDPTSRKLLVGSNPSALLNDIDNNPKINGDDRDKANFLVSHNANSVAHDIIQGLGTMSKSGVATALKKMEPTSNSASTAITEISRSTSSTITNRTNKINTASSIDFTDQSNSVAAGDSALEYGAWFSPFYEQARQSLRSLKAGFKSHSFGATLGYDARVDDLVTAGAAISYIDTKINHRDSKSGDKTKIDSAILSIYGIKEFLNNWFMQSNGSVGYNFVKNSERRDIARDFSQQAKSKYNLTSYSLQLLAGYDYRITRSFMATPMFGILGERISKISYRENGASIQNLIINRKPTNRVEAIVGGKLTLAKEIQKTLLTSELHSFVNYNFIHKATGIKANFVNIADPLPISTVKPSKFSYNIGGGIEASYGIMKYGLVYDALIEHRYISHQATIKAQVDL